MKFRDPIKKTDKPHICEVPRFTEGDKDDALHIRVLFGRDDTIRRTCDGALLFGDIVINGKLLPSIKIGQEVALGDIIHE